MDTENKHRAIVRISYELLCDVFFPEGTKIFAVTHVRDTPEFECMVEHPDLPGTNRRDDLPTICPNYRRVHERGDPHEMDRIEFTDWGLGK